MVYLLDEMEDAKLIERVRNPADRRSFLIQLTDRGRTTQRKAARALAGQTGRLLHPLTQAERRRASRSIGRRGAREPGYGSLCPAGTHEPV
jgi:DNA-binding MarR family transcriptional regulator